MNILALVEAVIGLFFVYAVLSLIVTIIQAGLENFLQLRAVHLRQSIESLLTGNNNSDLTATNFVDQLYQHPFIEALYQESQGFLAVFLRTISHSLQDLCRKLTGIRNVFGSKRGAPVDIPPDTFAVALMQTLNIEQLGIELSKSTIIELVQDRVALIQDFVNAIRNSMGDDSLLESDLAGLKRALNVILDDFDAQRINFSDAVSFITGQVIQFINEIETIFVGDHYVGEIVLRRLPYLKRAILDIKISEPTIIEVASLFSESNPSPKLEDIVKATCEPPNQLKRNLLVLSKYAQRQAKDLQEGIWNLEKEIADWYIDSMRRLPVSYETSLKRNALIIGFIIAIILNADTFYLLGTFTQNSTLPDLVSQASSPSNDSSNQSNSLNEAAQPAPTVSFPIGWDEVNVYQQFSLERNSNLPPSLVLPKRFLGWFISGIGISLGGAFWFDQIGKVISLRK